MCTRATLFNPVYVNTVQFAVCGIVAVFRCRVRIGVRAFVNAAFIACMGTKFIQHFIHLLNQVKNLHFRRRNINLLMRQQFYIFKCPFILNKELNFHSCCAGIL